jgi:hypothetical protein
MKLARDVDSIWRGVKDHISQGVLGSFDPNTGFVFQRLPSKQHDIAGHSWSIPRTSDAVVLQFMMDPSQNLLAVFSCVVWVGEM